MNIFITDECPRKCAEALDDKRVIKMILESAQMLSTAIWERGGEGFYRSTHINHPCSKWVRETKENYKWLFTHFLHLCEEYQNRFSKEHKCLQYFKEMDDGYALVPEGKLTPFPNCSLFKDDLNVFHAYKKTLATKWANDKRPPKWTNSEPPSWVFIKNSS